MKRFKKIVIAICIGVVLSVSFGGCNTISGMGRDIESVGQALQ